MSEWKEILDRLDKAQKVMIGLGQEWALKEDGRPVRDRHLTDPAQKGLLEAYQALVRLTEGKDYFIATTVTDGAIYETELDPQRITAPCGNIHWRQCSKACTKDIWEEGEIPEDVCPHCGAPLTGNTIQAETYIEEGYLPQWKKYTQWQTQTLNRDLVILELGAGFDSPTVIRWPFEKIAYINQKAWMFRVHETLSQLPAQLKERADRISENSLLWICGLAKAMDSRKGGPEDDHSDH